MNRLRHTATYFKSNAASILWLFLLALTLISFLPSSLTIRSVFINVVRFFSEPQTYITNERILGVVAVIFLMGALSWARLVKLIRRYRATYSVQRPYFSVLGFSLWFLGFFIFLLITREFLAFRFFIFVSALITGVCLLILYYERRHISQEKQDYAQASS
ncbi:MAG TPA: hypothetical protein VIQ24_03605, partial [Pyrinomonadaceae bacterium]